jgi:hypothetical protein
MHDHQVTTDHSQKHNLTPNTVPNAFGIQSSPCDRRAEMSERVLGMSFMPTASQKGEGDGEYGLQRFLPGTPGSFGGC